MIKQVSSENWKIEDYKPVAGIGYTPTELAQAYKISFHRGCDDLDNYDVAVFICDDDYLMLHAYIELPETTIYVHNKTADRKGLVLKYLSDIGIDAGKITWWADE